MSDVDEHLKDATAFQLSITGWLIVLAALIALVILWPLISGRFWAIGDMRDVYIPLESFFHEQQLQFNLPAWNPLIAWGFPVIAAAQIGFFYPPLLVLRFLPLFIYLPLVFALHVIALFSGMYLFLRSLALSREASFFGSMSFALSAFIWQHMTHLNIFLAVSWLPWQMLAMHSLTSQKLTARRGAILVLLLGIPFLIGQIQIPALMAGISLLYGMYRMFTDRERELGEIRRPVAFVAAVVVGVGFISAAQVLPTWELSQQSSRSTGGDFSIMRANQHSYPLYHLPALLFPRFYGSDDTYWGKRLEIEYGFFIGTIPLLFAVLALLKKLQRPYSFFALLGLISFLLALGGLSPFRFIGLEPSLWVFSAPARWLLFATFALSVFAGKGFDQRSELVREYKRSIITVLVTLIVLCVGATAFVYQDPGVYAPKLFSSVETLIGNSVLTKDTSFYVEKIETLVSSARTSSISLASPFTYLPLLSLLILTLPLKSKYTTFVFLIVTAIELSIVTVSTTPTLAWKDILSPPETISILPESVRAGQARIYSLRDGGDTGAFFTDPSSRADDAKRLLQRRLLLPLAHSQFGIGGVEWPASLDILAQAKVLEQLHGDEGPALPKKALAQDLGIGAVLVPEEMVTEKMGEPATVQAGVAVFALDQKPRFTFIDGSGADKPEYVTNIEAGNYEIKASITNPEDGAFVVRDTWYPGWRAYINGQEASILRAKHAFREVLLSPGEHEVVMEYMPGMLYLGLLLSGMTSALCCAMIMRRT